MDYQTEVLFLGTSSCIPDIGNDTSCMLINQKYLFDTGWSATGNLRLNGIDPTQVSHLFFTHMHHDHYLSLPSIIFYFLCKQKPLNELKIIGPRLDVERVVSLAYSFLQIDKFYTNVGYPVVIALEPGESYSNEEILVDTCSTLHPVQGLCYRITDRKTEKVISITGDTAYYPPLVEHIINSNLLIHEASLGPIAADYETNRNMLHSGAEDAGRVAMEANVDKLYIVHGMVSKSKECIIAASKYFENEILWPEIGIKYIV